MKRKVLSRFMAASLVGVMTLSLAGCGNGGGNDSSGAGNQGGDNSSQQNSAVDQSSAGNQNSEADQPQEDVEPYPVLTDKDGNVPDLGGMEIIVRDWFSGDGTRAEASDASTEALYEYQDWAQEKYNFKITQMQISGWGSTPEDFLNYVTGGGDDVNYVFVLRTGTEFEEAKANGLMYDLSTLDCLDFSQEKWNSGVHEVNTDADGKILAMRPIYAEPRGGLYFNKRVITEAGINPDDIYKWQESGEWTWDKFLECCEKITRDTDNDGVNDVYAITCQDTVFYDEVICSNNAHYVAKENGKYVNKLESNETVQAMNWALDTWQKHHYPMPEGAVWDYFMDVWKEGKAGFFADQVYRMGQDFGPNKDENGVPDGTYKVPDELGFVCFPKGPNASDYSNWYSDNPYVIPACYDPDRAWKIAFALNAWTETPDGLSSASAYISGLRANFRDTEACDFTIPRLVANGGVTYHGQVSGLSTGNDIYWKLNENNSLAQQLEKIRDKWNYYIALANGENPDKPQSMIEEEEAAAAAAAEQ